MTDNKAKGVKRLTDWLLAHTHLTWPSDISTHVRQDYEINSAEFLAIIREEFPAEPKPDGLDQVVEFLRGVARGHRESAAHLKLYSNGQGHIGSGSGTSCDCIGGASTMTWGTLTELRRRTRKAVEQMKQADQRAEDIAIVQRALNVHYPQTRAPDAKVLIEAFARICAPLTD